MSDTLQGSPTFLIVDDEELMREVTSIMIEDHGGKVLTAVDGLDAVEVFAEHKGEVDFILMDFSMPRMNGYEAYCKIKEMDPEVKVIMVSGLKITAEVAELRDSGEVRFLSKPFHEDELFEVVKKISTGA